MKKFASPALLALLARTPAVCFLAHAGPVHGLQFYDHGNPTVHEQLMLELVNKARANPAAEAARIGIDLNQGLAAGTISTAPKPPVAHHRFLINAARDHSQWMLDTNTFSHTGAGGSSPGQRAAAAGYANTVGENIVWGGAVGPLDVTTLTRHRHDDLFFSPGHRQNICTVTHREVGIGIRVGKFFHNGVNHDSVMVTQKLGLSASSPSPFLVGAVYYDFNGDGLYDVGEGIAGIDVTIENGAYHTATAEAGGYVMPMPATAGTRSVTFRGHGLNKTIPVAFAGGVNHKVDLVLPYAPPVLSGTASVLAGLPAVFGLSAVPGATSLEVATLAAKQAPADNAENLSRVIDGTSPSYHAISTAVKHQGSGAYRIAHPDGVANEFLEYSKQFRPGPAATLSFRSRLGWASRTQKARVELSINGGASWIVVYEQAGTLSQGETTFHLRSVNLGAYAGRTVRLRFNYYLEAGGSYYYQTSNGVGWYVDAINLTDIDEIDEITVDTLTPGKPFVFTAPAEGSYLFVARAAHHARPWPGGPLFEVTAAAGSYGDWAANWESAAGLAAGTIAAHPDRDHSGDGLPNLAAHALGLSPLGTAPEQRPRWVPAGDAPTFEYTVETAAIGLSVRPELSSGLQTWHSPGDPALGFATTDTLIETKGTIHRRRIAFPNGAPPALIARIRVSGPS